MLSPYAISLPISIVLVDVYVCAAPLPILYVPLVAFFNPIVSANVSVEKFPPSFEIVGCGSTTIGSAL